MITREQLVNIVFDFDFVSAASIDRIMELITESERKQDEYENELWNKIRQKERRVLELEIDAEIREEANRKLLSFGIKTGMERAAEIVETHESSGRSVWDIPNISIRMVTKAIRKEIT